MFYVGLITQSRRRNMQNELPSGGYNDYAFQLNSIFLPSKLYTSGFHAFHTKPSLRYGRMEGGILSLVSFFMGTLVTDNL